MENEAYYKAYFGQQSSYYLEKMEESANGKKNTFNIGAFFTGMFWLLYRKMYLYAIGITAALILLGYVEEFVFQSLEIPLGFQQAYTLVSSLLFAILFGFIGNRLYFSKASREIAGILSTTENEEERMMLLKKKGGVSIVPWIALAVVIALLLMEMNVL
jgi:hypothetical protein